MSMWPIDWPPTIDITVGYDPYDIAMAEEAAAHSMRMLTLYRVGGLPITVYPRTARCRHPFTGGQFGHSYLPFHPILLDSGAYGNCWCGAGCDCEGYPAIILEAPVGRIDAVYVDNALLPNTAYRVEDHNRLVRMDGGTWPSCSNDFRVTYLNAYEVDIHGQAAGGALAVEFLKLRTNPASCRLPKSVTELARQGIQMTITTGMFPDMMTGIDEVDVYLRRWNPNALKVRPQVYSIDLPPHRTVTWEA